MKDKEPKPGQSGNNMNRREVPSSALYFDVAPNGSLVFQFDGKGTANRHPSGKSGRRER